MLRNIGTLFVQELKRRSVSTAIAAAETSSLQQNSVRCASAYCGARQINKCHFSSGSHEGHSVHDFGGHSVHDFSNHGHHGGHGSHGNTAAIPVSKFDHEGNHGLDCLQFDLSKIDFDHKSEKTMTQIEMMNDVIKTDVETMKPHIVYLQQMQEGHYIMKIKMMLERMGYESLFQPTHNGRGQATFIRHDICPEHIRSVFKSWHPDPC